MLFSIGEDGDLYIDKKNNSFSDYTGENESEINFKIARSSIITFFKHKGFLEKEFIKYKRNNFTDSFINNIIQNKLNLIFKDNPEINEKIGFSFINQGDLFVICFFYKIDEDENKSLLYETINI